MEDSQEMVEQEAPGTCFPTSTTYLAQSVWYHCSVTPELLSLVKVYSFPGVLKDKLWLTVVNFSS